MIQILKGRDNRLECRRITTREKLGISSGNTSKTFKVKPGERLVLDSSDRFESRIPCVKLKLHVCRVPSASIYFPRISIQKYAKKYRRYVF